MRCPRTSTHSVWVIYYEAQNISIRRKASKHAEQLAPGDVLEEPDLLPGFRVPVEDIFARIPIKPRRK